MLTSSALSEITKSSIPSHSFPLSKDGDEGAPVDFARSFAKTELPKTFVNISRGKINKMTYRFLVGHRIFQLPTF